MSPATAANIVMGGQCCVKQIILICVIGIRLPIHKACNDYCEQNYNEHNINISQ